jgi:hypothetical protein
MTDERARQCRADLAERATELAFTVARIQARLRRIAAQARGEAA